MDNKKTSTITMWATIFGCIFGGIACIFAGLQYYSTTHDNSSSIPGKETPSRIETEEYRKDHEICMEMTTWDKIFLPFIEHKEMNYHKHEWNEKGWMVFLGYLGIIELLLIGILTCGAHCLGYFDGDGSSGNLYGKILSGISAILLLIYMILRILAQIGKF